MPVELYKAGNVCKIGSEHAHQTRLKVFSMKNRSAMAAGKRYQATVYPGKETRYHYKVKEELKIRPFKSSVPPPPEELVNYLNRIGREYPFCVCFKYKSHDPL